MPLSRVLDYGDCPCGGKYESRTVEVRFNRASSEPLVLNDVPQGACPACGSRVYKAQVLELIETAFRTSQLAAKQTPVLSKS